MAQGVDTGWVDHCPMAQSGVPAVRTLCLLRSHELNRLGY